MTNLFMGCDVSKGYADFAVLDEQRNKIEKPFQLDDTRKGHEALERYVKMLLTRYPDGLLHIGVESTGSYENNWLNKMQELSKQLPVKCARINPCGVSKFRDAELIRTSTDEVSAIAIAGYMQAHSQKIIYDQDDIFYTARRQWSSIALMKKVSSQLKNSLQMQLYTSNPGLLNYCKHGTPDWVLLLLAKYPTAADLAKTKLQSIIKCAGISEKKALSVLENITGSVTSTTDVFTCITIKQLVTQILSIEQSITVLENELIKKWADNPMVKLVSSVKGIGVSSAVGLLINIRDISLFSSSKKLASYFGLHPTYRQSGDGSWGCHMSKKGRVQPRAILYMCTLSAIVHNPLIKDCYSNSKRKGHSSLAAIGLCMHKMIRIVYGILKSNTPFDPEIDKRNREKVVNKNEVDHQEQKRKRVRRYQPADIFAPVSLRQSKKRRSNGSQSNELLNAGSPSSLSKNNTVLV